MTPGFVLIDVDDVLLDLDRGLEAGEAAAGRALADALGAPALGPSVQASLQDVYATLRAELRRGDEAPSDALAELLDGLRRHQGPSLADGHELKPWSRQAMLMVVAERLALRVDGAAVERAAEAYWTAVTEATPLFEDARRALARWRAAGVPVQAATNSDGVMSWDAARGGFAYTAEAAAARKRRRIARLSELGLEAEAITIGDPIGKPDPRFFEAAIEALEARVGRLDRRRGLAIGDSLHHDVRPALAVGVGAGLWLVRRGGPRVAAPLAGHPGVKTAASLDAI